MRVSRRKAKPGQVIAYYGRLQGDEPDILFSWGGGGATKRHSNVVQYILGSKRMELALTDGEKAKAGVANEVTSMSNDSLLLQALKRLVASDDAHGTIHATDGDDVKRMIEYAEAFDHAREVIAAHEASSTTEPKWQALTPEIMNGLVGQYWLALHGKTVLQGEYAWRQGWNPEGFNTVSHGRIPVSDVTHVMTFAPPALPALHP